MCKKTIRCAKDNKMCKKDVQKQQDVQKTIRCTKKEKQCTGT